MDDKEVDTPKLEETKLFDLADLPPVDMSIHQWRQQGTRLYCTSCPSEHATILDDIDLQLYGIDEKGLPLFRKVEVHD